MSDCIKTRLKNLVNDTLKPRKLLLTDSRFPIPDSRFPITYYLFPVQHF
ncbi:hypothetical protein [Moorena producens]|nr:hypothetical protein [Moorena producens]